MPVVPIPAGVSAPVVVFMLKIMIGASYPLTYTNDRATSGASRIGARSSPASTGPAPPDASSDPAASGTSLVPPAPPLPPVVADPVPTSVVPPPVVAAGPLVAPEPPPAADVLAPDAPKGFGASLQAALKNAAAAARTNVVRDIEPGMARFRHSWCLKRQRHRTRERGADPFLSRFSNRACDTRGK